MREKKIRLDPEKKKWAFPHTYLILVALCAVMILLTNFLPAGEYDRTTDADGRTVVVAGTYHQVEPAPISLADLPVKLQQGMAAGAEIMMFMLVVGGSLGIINEAGAINFFICGVLSRKLRNREKLFIPVLLFIMALGGISFGMNLEAAAFVPAVAALSIVLGYDSLLAVAIVFLGSNIGYTAGVYNPYNVGVAQSLAELPLYSGAWYRWIFLAVQLAVTSVFLIRYADQVKADPGRSLMRGVPEAQEGWTAPQPEEGRGSVRQWLGLLIFVAGFAAIICGSIRGDWWIPQIGGAFFWVAILTGVVFRFSPNKMCALFANGTKDIITGALSVGFARTIATVLTDGHIMDTIVNYLAMPLGMIPRALQTAGMMVAQSVINLGIPSGSAQATATMPIIIPLSDLLGMSRQAAVFAFQCGDGISNGLIPTYTTLIALLAIAKVPYDRWIKFAFRIVAVQWLIGLGMCVIASAVGY